MDWELMSPRRGVNGRLEPERVGRAILPTPERMDDTRRFDVAHSLGGVPVLAAQVLLRRRFEDHVVQRRKLAPILAFCGDFAFLCAC
jgi:hypothetical protein